MSSTLHSSTVSESFSEEASEAQKAIPPQRQLEALYALAFELYRAGYFDKAADLFRLLCLYEPANPRNWIALGGANQRTKQHEAAVAAFLMAAQHDPLDPDARLYAAHSFIDMMDLPAALDSVRTTLKLCQGRQDKEKIKARATSLLKALENL